MSVGEKKLVPVFNFDDLYFIARYDDPMDLRFHTYKYNTKGGFV
jgi:hypothetical protein